VNRSIINYLFLIINFYLLTDCSFCQNWSTVNIDSSSSMAFYSTEVFIDSNNAPHIFYFSGEEQLIKHAYIQNDNWVVETTPINTRYDDVDYDKNDNAHFITNFPNLQMLRHIVLSSSGDVYEDTILSTSYLISDARIAIDSNGYGHVVANVSEFDGLRIKYFEKSDLGWQEYNLTDLPGDYGGNDIKLFQNGKVSIMNVSSSNPSTITYYNNLEGYWIDQVVYTGDIRTNVFTDIDSANFIHAVFGIYIDQFQDRLVYLNNLNSNWNIEEFVSSIFSPLSPMPIRISENNYVNITFYSDYDFSPQLVFLYKNISADDFCHEVIDGDGYPGNTRALAIDETNNIHVCYVENFYPGRVVKYALRHSLTDIKIENDSSDQNSDLNNIIIYPNPFNGEINLSFSNNADEDVAAISIFNLNGSRVFSGNVHIKTGNNSININLDNLSSSVLTSGVYFIKFHIGQRPCVTKKITFIK